MQDSVEVVFLVVVFMLTAVMVTLAPSIVLVLVLVGESERVVRDVTSTPLGVTTLSTVRVETWLSVLVTALGVEVESCRIVVVIFSVVVFGA